MESTTRYHNAKKDIYYTPDEALQLLLPFLRSVKSIWDPAAGANKRYPLKTFFESRGKRVIPTDICEGEEFNFMTFKTRKRFDAIVTTPPYNMRKEFILRCYELDKPFALICPINVLESKLVRNAFKSSPVSIVFPPKNISFMLPDNTQLKNPIPYSVFIIKGIPGIPPVKYL